jgi:hypothetical protein
MAQESVPTGQDVAQTQTVKITRMYRSTGMGGVDVTWVFTVDGQVVKPNVKQRSRTGNHGWDTWVLPEGRYIIVSASRPNLKNGAKPYSVTIQCVEVKDGKLNITTERRLYVMSIEDVKNWALSIC